MKKALFLVVFGLVVAGCGKTGEGNKDAYQADGKSCSQQFVSDYNAVVRVQDSTDTKNAAQLNTLKTKVQSFKSTYQGVRCDLSIQGEKKTVDASVDSDKLIAEIDTFLKKAK